MRAGAGFATIDLHASYSGDSLHDCAGKNWSCHLDVLELLPSAPLGPR